MKYITTVCGDITSEELGFTSAHEHLIMNMESTYENICTGLPKRPEGRENFCIENMVWARANPFGYRECYVSEDKAIIKKEVEEFQKYGGNAIVECSPIDMRGDVRLLKEISAETGVNIICATGLGKSVNMNEYWRNLNERQRYEVIIKEITNGIEDTGIKPGIVKCMPEVHKEDESFDIQDITNFHASARAAADSGLPLYIHSLPTLSSAQVVQMVEMAIYTYGMEPDKIVMCHQCHASSWTYVPDLIHGLTDRKPNFKLTQALLDMGVNIGIDTFGGVIGYDNSDWLAADDYTRLQTLAHFIDAGYEDHIVLGQDLFLNVEGVQVGMPGFTRISEFALPMMRKAGYEDVVLKKLVIDNPARILAK